MYYVLDIGMATCETLTKAFYTDMTKKKYIYYENYLHNKIDSASALSIQIALLKISGP